MLAPWVGRTVRLARKGGSEMIRRTLVAAGAAALLLALGALPAAAAERVTASVLWMPPSGLSGSVAGAEATLVTGERGASFTIHTGSLKPGEAYTVWWVIFNDPAACTTNPAGPIRCGAGDVPRAGVRASLQYGAGHVVGESGVGNFAGSLREGDTSGCQPVLPCNAGLEDATSAEIHLVVRTHGAAAPGYVPDQIGSFNGGCNAGEPNEGKCKNVQGAPFAA